jgi:hypothetical protein
VGSSITSWDQHLPLAIEAINAALDGIAPERVRLHVCWGNYAGPHHCDVPFADIAGEVVKANVGTIYPEGGNPRHEHEWRVFGDLELPDRMTVILGVIDTKTNYIEHPQVVADRLVRVGKLIGRDRLMAGTDCGFDTFIKFSQVDPAVAWHKLEALVQGAETCNRGAVLASGGCRSDRTGRSAGHTSNLQRTAEQQRQYAGGGRSAIERPLGAIASDGGAAHRGGLAHPCGCVVLSGDTPGDD